MELLQTMLNRRSVRKYTEENIPKNKLDTVLKAGLASPSAKNIKPWEFVVVQDREILEKLSNARIGASKMLAGAACAIAVFGDTSKTDVWVEDCCIALTNMHLMADHLGLGSCWIQCRLRPAPTGQTTEAYVKELLNVPMEFALEGILSLGMITDHPRPHTEEDLLTEKIHYEKF